MYKYILPFLLLSVGNAWAETPVTITLRYYERPPFMLRLSDGSAGGLLADPAHRVFEQAHISYHWMSTPAKRQLRIIEANDGYDCGIGWYRNPERLNFAQFTKPIYRDRGVVAIAAASFQLANNTPLTKALEDTNTRILIKSGLTYGTYVNRLIERTKAQIENTTLEQPQMVRMIAHLRADLMFSTMEEAQMLTTQDETGKDAVRVLSFPDIPPGENRYIMCSKKVPAEIIRALNNAIDTLNIKP